MDSRQVGAPELSKIILQDPSLTARILKLSNSPYYNPAGLKINTISRGIVILGYQTIREITLTCSFIETFVSISRKPKVNQKIAHALHAAIQAKSFAILNDDPCPEEVFIATLLKDLGHISFACFDKDKYPQIEARVKEKQIAIESAEQEILGFTLKELGSSLSRNWKLEGVLDPNSTMNGKACKRSELVQVCHTIAECFESEAPPESLEKPLAQIAKWFNKPLPAVQAVVSENREKFFKMALQFGVQAIANTNPNSTNSKAAVKTPAAQPVNLEDPGLQLKILQDITNLLSGKIDLNLIFEMVMEGIYRAAGMDRTLFGVLTPDRREIKEKSTLGWPIESEKLPIKMAITGPINLFSHSIQQVNAAWVKPDVDQAAAALYTRQVIEQIGKHECFIARLALNNKAIGLLYADRSRRKEPLTQRDFESFCLFVRQANIALALSRPVSR